MSVTTPTKTSRIAEALSEGQAAQQAGRLDEAKQHYERVLKADPDNPDALHLMGVLAYQHGQYPLAVKLITRALARRAHFPAALNNLGGALLAIDELDAAEQAFEAALRQQPGYSDALNNLGNVAYRRGDLDAAERHFRRAIHADAEAPNARNNLGNIHRDRGDWAAAEAAYREALRRNPDYREAHHNLANVLTKLGTMEEAIAGYRRSLALHPAAVESLDGLAHCKKFGAEDPDLELFPAAAAHAARWSRRQRTAFFFTWGKALDDAGRYDDAFRCFGEGNTIVRAERPFDPDRHRRFSEAVIERFPGDRLDTLAAADVVDETPVFILGMPRSGTTLVEQILSSHPAVHGGGELKVLGRTIGAEAGEPLERGFPEWLGRLDGDAVRRVGETYLAGLPAKAGASRVTDKMPSNFAYLGLIRLALPRARIIHCLRSPMDTCLSCYQKHFEEGQPYAFDLAGLGHYYRDYVRLMEHWRALFPGQWLDVSYEDMIDDTEAQARRLVDFAGLPWDDACLDFHRSRRRVETASFWQVRQPIYRSSLERWRRYQRHLGPLIEALGDARDWPRRWLVPD